ncbi:MAG TPA: efflux RND transporter permease subunit, partial [Pyrinomonadaceae bacterium]|nr:efflux RND transporter permease subunit [Pyrinomonadaceae bacterium]
LVIIASIALFAMFSIIVLAMWWRSGSDSTEVNVRAGATDEQKYEGQAATGEVKLSPEARAAAGIEIEGVTQRPAVALLRVTGTIETNPQQMNAGSGIQADTPLFTIANISTVWVIANVPEAQLGNLRVGTPAEVRSTAVAMMLKGENSRTVVDSIKERVETIKTTLPKGVELIPFYDRTELVNRTIWTVSKNLIEGAVLVIIVLILLLGNWRGSLLVATVIPLSMLFAAICMRIFNVSGNLMSLGSLDFGLIVDGAVIVVENTVRRRAEAQHSGAKEPPERTILEACLEVGRPVVFAVAIITIVYLPILSLTGIEGKMFKPMALTVVFALIGALILSLTYVPAAMTFILRGRVAEKESFFIRYAKRWYVPALEFVMQRRLPTLAVVTAIVLGSFALFPFLGAEFIPRLEEGSLAIQMQQLPSVSLSHSVVSATEVEKVLRGFPEVTKVISKTGRAEVATDPMSVDLSDIYVELKPPSQWTTADTREELVGSMALVGFGFDSLIEVTSGAVLLWRLQSDVDEARRERVEAISLRIVGICFVVLAIYG